VAAHKPTRMLILCHSGGWDRLYQAASAAASAATLGRRVDLVFFFHALDRLLKGQLDEVRLDPADPMAEAHLEERIDVAGTLPVSRILEGARATGLVRLYACSASTALMGHEVEEAAAAVDEVIGWPTVVRLMDGAPAILYI
jgi:peroxiredoxin family protein